MHPVYSITVNLLYVCASLHNSTVPSVRNDAHLIQMLDSWPI
jgi:hypothetical protein